jgi:type VI protein secretion system component Hcp
MKKTSGQNRKRARTAKASTALKNLEPRKNPSGGKKTTPKLYEAACKGTHLPEIVIE